MLPLVSFTALETDCIERDHHKNIATKIAANFKTKPVTTSNDNNEEPMGDIGII